MKYSMAQTLEVVAGHVPVELVARPAWERVRRVADCLPAALVQGFYLECRLGAEDPEVDLIVRIERAGQEIIAGCNPKVGLPQVFRDDEAWHRLSRLCAAWADDPLLRATVSHLWLEFDLGGAGICQPSAFVAFDSGTARTLDPRTWTGVLDRLVEYMVPDASTFDTRAFRAAVGRVQTGITIPYFGFMLTRQTPVIRVYAAWSAAAALTETLAWTGWAGNASELSSEIQRLSAGGGIRGGLVHVDMAEGVMPYVGVEYALQRRTQLSGRIAEERFLHDLVAAGLCTEVKSRALARWPGCGRHQLDHELWTSVVMRRVNHVKLVYRPGAALEAKAYLLTHWRPTSW